MDLKDFIVQTVVDINSAQTEINEKIWKCPMLANDKSTSSGWWAIAFDLSVSWSTEAEWKAGASINVLWLQLGELWTSGTISSQNTSRIKFTINVNI